MVEVKDQVFQAADMGGRVEAPNFNMITFRESLPNGGEHTFF
jgi:hypothetical protein